MKACGDPNHGEHVTVPAPCHLSEGGGRLISRQQVMVLIEIYYRPMMMMPLGHWPIGPCRTIPYMLHTTILVALPLLRCYRYWCYWCRSLFSFQTPVTCNQGWSAKPCGWQHNFSACGGCYLGSLAGWVCADWWWWCRCCYEQICDMGWAATHCRECWQAGLCSSSSGVWIQKAIKLEQCCGTEAKGFKAENTAW